jgi:hypothetical protein
MSDVLCKDCKHSFRKLSEFPQWGSGYELRCRLNYIENEVVENRVTGNTIRPAYYERCSLTRMEYLSKDRNGEICGKAGNWWTPQNKKDLFKFIKHVSV